MAKIKHDNHKQICQGHALPFEIQGVKTPTSRYNANYNQRRLAIN